MTDDELQSLIDEASFDFAMGETETAREKLRRATEAAPASFAAWHALAEVAFQARALDEALHAAERAAALRPEDVFIHTTLSRIWMEKGDKTTAEQHGARARVLGWKDQLTNPAAHQGGLA